MFEKTYKISLNELNNWNYNLGYKEVLEILKKKGAPVDGVFSLIPDTINYEWKSTFEANSKYYIFQVRRRKNANK